MTHTQTSATLTQRWQKWSPRSRVRVDLAQVHEYRSAPWPRGALTVPTATYLASREGLFRWLAFDFDSAKYGADAVKADAAILAAVLDELDVPYLLVQSGPTGGVHIWVLLDDAGANADDVDRLAHALQAHLPTLDISPLTNADTGCVRIPGSPHRHGGHAVPIAGGHDLEATLTAMDQRRTSAELLTWLHARFPTRESSACESAQARGPAAATPGLTITGTGAGAHLARARTDLTPATRRLLTEPLPAGADRSAIAWSILLGMAASGCTWRDVTTHLDQPGLIRLREDYDRHQAHAIVQWEKALDAAAATAWPRTAADRVDDATSELLAAVSAAAADGPRWARPGGESDERVLLAFLALCEQAHATTINVDVRRLGEAANVDHTTVSRSLRRLAAESWVHLQSAAEGTAAATWTLRKPPPCTAAPQVETRPHPPRVPHEASARLDHAHHDVWVWRHGLGGVGERVHFYWSQGVPVDEIATATGYSQRTVHRWISILGGYRLLSWRPRLETAARIVGAAGAMLARARRHQVERAVFDWWREELVWRRTPGKKRRKTGPTRASTDPAAIALPIAAPARTRFGRFPTKPGGKMHWAAAFAAVTDRSAAAGGAA